ncbi:hypothetical protein EKH55_3116 [Sinorhizobium alkalisoli]|nr:hypothetical protein EKH55_3116 [Sinorhizobium alkalisoli]
MLERVGLQTVNISDLLTICLDTDSIAIVWILRLGSDHDLIADH